MKPSETLTAAAQLIKDVGFYQGDYVNINGDPCTLDGVCTLGALALAASNQAEPQQFTSFEPLDAGLRSAAFTQAVALVAHHLRFYDDGRKPFADTSLAEWNDTPGRTQQEVVDMLNQVAATQREREATP